MYVLFPVCSALLNSADSSVVAPLHNSIHVALKLCVNNGPEFAEFMLLKCRSESDNILN